MYSREVRPSNHWILPVNLSELAAYDEATLPDQSASRKSSFRDVVLVVVVSRLNVLNSSCRMFHDQCSIAVAECSTINLATTPLIEGPGPVIW
jgi:hypothetical protein